MCLFAAITSGCSVTRGTRTPDGTLTVSNYRLLWKSERVNFKLSTLDHRLAAQLSIGASASDDAAVAAVTEGVVKGVLGRP